MCEQKGSRHKAATLVGMAGLEPARIAPTDFKSGASTDFATSPRGRQPCEPTRLLGQVVSAGLAVQEWFLTNGGGLALIKNFSEGVDNLRNYNQKAHIDYGGFFTS